MVFERVEAAPPELAIGGKPPIHLGERLGPQPVKAPLALRPHAHKAGLAQHAQMLRHPGLAEREPVHQLPDGAFTVAEEVEDAPPLGFGEDVEGGVHGGEDYSMLIYQTSDITRNFTKVGRFT